MNGEHPIVLFDGECKLCQRSFQFIIKKERNKTFKFGFLQDEQIRRELHQRFAGKQIPDSLVLVHKTKIYLESTAALRIAIKLKFPYNLFSAFLLLPSFLRDPVYRLIAKKRFSWFGKSDHCLVPDQQVLARFTSSIQP